jgi:dsDNA-specific endonuclease/ATPase MutS2
MGSVPCRVAHRNAGVSRLGPGTKLGTHFGATEEFARRWYVPAVDAEDDEAVALPIDGVLDLHTFRPEEVSELVQDYLDECVRLGIHEVRIIHGKGKGTLRRSVHAALARRSDVLEFGLAPFDRGGWGATLVTLRPAG